VCRHLAYLGPPCSPAGVLFDAGHSLLRQSYAPADMRGGGTVNADGFGLGWYPDTGGAPLRYRRATPLWTDRELLPLARSLRTTAFLAAVRNGTHGMPIAGSACAPFTDGRWLFSHNGLVPGWPGSLAGPASMLPVTDLLTLDAPLDSAVLWALLRARLRDGVDPLAAVSWLVGEVAAAAPGARLNFLLTDGRVLVGTAWTHALSVRHTGGEVLVASEPVDTAPGWEPVPDGYAVRAERGDVELRPLKDGDR
jgi:glutamine amidotransferase